MKKKLLCFLISFGLMFSVYSADVWREGSGASVISGGDSPSAIDTLLDAASTEPLDRLLQEYRSGAKISYSSTSALTVAAGQVAVQNSAGSIVAFLDNTSSTSVDWEDIETGGSESASTRYYLFAYCTTPSSDTDFDIVISTSSSAPASGTYYARLGSFYNNSSSDIEQIYNDDTTEILMVSGTITHGGTIPLPSGYDASQCTWTVSINSLTRWAGGSDLAWTETCSVNSSRVVTIKRVGWSSVTGTVNYIIAGVK